MNMKPMGIWCLAMACFLSLALVSGSRSALGRETRTGGDLVIHEWGTFTSLENENGEAIGGVNSDDEPVPKFVHRLGQFLLLGSEVPPSFCQGAPHCHPDVTMRLETPVIYFHPGSGSPKGFDVSATFKGGWLSEYYPDAVASESRNVFGPLESNTESVLTWKDVELGGDWQGPDTKQHVWTAPRTVNAAAVRVGSESEKFLFYRGVAHIDAPIKVIRAMNSPCLTLRNHLPPELAGEPNPGAKRFWLVHIRRDGRIAFQTLGPSSLGGPEQGIGTAVMKFQPGEYASSKRDALKSSLKTALCGEGLFDDEAQALLDTWDLSYFKSPGWRLFFLVPRAWTDFYLPLKVSIPAEITRVMVGRVELISDDQRDALRQLASTPPEAIKSQAIQLRAAFYTPQALNAPENRAVFEGGKPLDSLPISIPKTYGTYLSLGRFRDALLLDWQKNHPSQALAEFINDYQLQAHDPERFRLAGAK
jgi:hypothetical protein